MAEIKKLFDEYAVINNAQRSLPDDKHRLLFLEALAELENNECHKNRQFPVTRLHKMSGVKQTVYRGDVGKMPGWRIYVQYSKDDGALHLKDLAPPSKHDDPDKVVDSKSGKYW